MERSKIKQKKRPLSASHRRNQRSSVGSEEDTRSLENQTNFDWCKGCDERKRKKKLEQNEVDCEALYFIDQLKTEFCEQKPEGWYEVKKDVPKDVLNEQLEFATERRGKVNELEAGKNGGRWTKDEHQLFLEGLKLFGKDWPKIEEHVKTRPVKNIVSHAQKFMVKLLQFLDKGKPISQMKREEAEYFYGILNKKYHWTQKAKEIQLDPPSKPAELHKAPALSNQASSYEKWKQQFEMKSASFHGSLGHSIKMVLNVSKASDAEMKVCFLQAVDLSTANSDGWKSNGCYLKKFSIDIQDVRNNEDLYHGMAETLTQGLLDLPDLDADETDVELFIKFGKSGHVFDVVSGQPIETVLHNFAGKDIFDIFEESHPNLAKVLKAKKHLKVDLLQECPSLEPHASYPLIDFIRGLTPEELQAHIDEGLTYQMKRRDDLIDLKRMDLDSAQL